MNVENRPSSIHGVGLFAREPIAEDTYQFLYGMLIGVETPYCIEWHDDGVFFEPFPPFRFINHDDDPNCEFLGAEDGTMFIRSTRDIDTDEELTVNYGYDPTEED